MIRWVSLVLLSLPVAIAGAQSPSAGAGSGIQWQWGVTIPLRDGVKLQGTLYRPRGQSEPLPCVFTLTPYISETYHDRGTYFAAHGYVFLIVDVRGRGNSAGEFAPFAGEADDGHDVVEWLARQPYCNGKVAMWGGSYAGYNQWATASRRPPHLATIVPAAAPAAGVDFPQLNNIPSAYMTQWLTFVSGRTLQGRILGDHDFWAAQFRHHRESHLPFAQLDRSIGNPSPFFQQWMQHPHPDAYWDRMNPTDAQYAAMTFPILTITGQYDSDQAGALEHYRRHLAARGASAAGARHFLIIGPWDHGQTRTPTAEVGGLKLGEASVVDLNALHKQWYDWTMKSGSRPTFLNKPVAYYVTGAEEWHYANSLQEITQEQRPWYLASGAARADDVLHAGRLQAESEHSQPDQYVYDPLELSDMELQVQIDPASLIDQRQLLRADGRRLVYQSSPFEQDTDLAGFFRFNAWIALDQPDTDFSVQIYQIAPDGGSLLLTETQLRARYRDSVRQPKLVPRAEVIEYRFDTFPFMARRITAGSRLRLVLGPVDSLYSQRNYNSGGVVAKESGRDARTVTVRLFHDPQHASVLHVPFAATTPRSPRRGTTPRSPRRGTTPRSPRRGTLALRRTR